MKFATNTQMKYKPPGVGFESVWKRSSFIDVLYHTIPTFYGPEKAGFENIFSFSHNVFYPIREREIIISATFILSAANAFNLYQCKILPFGKGLKDQYLTHESTLGNVKYPFTKRTTRLYLLSKELKPFLRNCDIDVSYKSDHSIILIVLQCTEIKHGKGLWKFNNSLLHDIDYINCINKKIDEILLQYCLPVYDHDYATNMDRSQVQLVINDQLFLETLLMKIRGKQSLLLVIKENQDQIARNYF